MVAAESILRRKAGAGRRPEFTQMSPEKAMKLAFGRAGRGIAGLGLRMSAFSIERSSVAALAASAAESTMVLTLAQGGSPGGAVFVDPGMTAALIEAGTMGRVGRGEVESRAPTRIDALVVAAFLDTALAAFDELAADLSVAATVTGWRPGEMLPAATVLPLMLEDVPMRLFRLGFDFAEGAREGRLTLAMPMDRNRGRGAGAEGLGPQLQNAVLAARANVRAVLARLNLPLDAVTTWEPGSLVPLSRELLTQVLIEDLDRVTVARGRLGQVNGARAVRIVSTGAA
jgi:flagellar motor switch protein FliM